MKIAIQGHTTRGKEVIQILEGLGGKNTSNHNGEDNYAYYISSINNHICKTSLLFSKYAYYTLEEFEKEFPFKIGDKVIYDYTPDFIGTVVDIKFDDNTPYRVDIKGTICTCGKFTLKLYKEMEKRNITLTLDKAKEWYNKGGELKEIALQAFTEKELNPLPRSWDEYCRKYEFCCFSTKYTNLPLKYDAIIKLGQLRDCWRQGWEPIWDCSEKWCIRSWGNDCSIGVTTQITRFLTFPTKEMAKEFLKCFRSLIEKAGDLI